MKHIWKQKAKCKSCGATGIYRGLGERGKAGVVCHECKGTGEVEIKIEWEDFEGRVRRDNVERVARVNVGITIDESGEFGGMPYKDWFEGKPFPEKSENRKYTCPTWWYQSTDWKLKPGWKECIWGRAFSSCPHFKEKDACWERWDKEFGREI